MMEGMVKRAPTSPARVSEGSGGSSCILEAEDAGLIRKLSNVWEGHSASGAE